MQFLKDGVQTVVNIFEKNVGVSDKVSHESLRKLAHAI